MDSVTITMYSNSIPRPLPSGHITVAAGSWFPQNRGWIVSLFRRRGRDRETRAEFPGREGASPPRKYPLPNLLVYDRETAACVSRPPWASLAPYSSDFFPLSIPWPLFLLDSLSLPSHPFTHTGRT